MVRERNQGQLVFSNKSSTESRPCRKLFRAVVQLDAHDEESTVTTHNQELLPGISSIVSEDIQNDKLQWDPSRDGHAIENELEPIPSRSEPPLSSCSNVQTDGIEAVEMSLVSVVLEQGDHPDVYVPLQESIEEPEPSPLQTVEVAMVPEVSEMIVLSQRDDSAVRELRPATSDGPQQPVLREYNPQNFGNETFTRDFQPKWFKYYPWLNYSVDRKVGTCYACSTFLKDNAFTFSNWEKPERLTKHHQSEMHSLAMTKWLEYHQMQRRSSSIISVMDDGHRKCVQRNRELLRVIIECLFYTAQQNIAHRSHEEDRSNLGQRSDVDCGNFLELLHLP